MSLAHVEEGSTYHPVTTPLADINDMIGTIAAYDARLPSLDVWSANVYRGLSFGNLFSSSTGVSTKPFTILEYGIDAV